MNTIEFTLKGLSEDLARRLADNIAGIIRLASTFDFPLDMRRLDRVIITDDLRAEFTSLSSETGRNIGYTDEDYALCVAKVLSARQGDDVTMTLVINANIAARLLSDKQEDIKFALHLLHHELAHVHDNNMQVDAFPDEWMKKQLAGVAARTFPLAEVLWSEYFATRTTSWSASAEDVARHIGLFRDALERTKRLVDEAIVGYRLHSDLDRLLLEAARHADFLLKAAAYVLGYLDGQIDKKDQVSCEVEGLLTSSYFKPIWDRLAAELRHVHGIYPSWSSLSIFDGLMEIVWDYFDILGLQFEDVPEGVFVRVPFRPETTPRA